MNKIQYMVDKIEESIQNYNTKIEKIKIVFKINRNKKYIEPNRILQKK